MTIQLKSLFLFMAVVGSLSLFSGDVVRADSATQALWVFSDELTNPADRQTLVQRSKDSGVTDLYVSVYQSTYNVAGRLMYQDSYIADLITQAHAQGIKVWAAYGALDWPGLGCGSDAFPMKRMAEVIAYNAANSTAKFDGVALDVEPQTADLALLTLYQCIQSYLENNGLKLAVAIRFYWDTPVEFGTSTKPLYQHIIDLPLDKVVVMGYRDSAGTVCSSNGIICLDQDEVNYAYSVGKVNLILVGLETSNCAPGCGDVNVTFYEEGETILNTQALDVENFFAGKIGGIAIHRYKDSYLGGLPGWPTHTAPADTTPPVIVPTVTGTLGNNGWYNSDVIVSWNVTDPESGIASSTGCGTTTLSADTLGTLLTCSATNSAGLSSSQSVTIKIDKTAPTISASAGSYVADTWKNQTVTVHYTCTDGGSNVATVTPDQVFSTDGVTASTSGTCTDNAGNSANASFGPIKVDKTAPTITITSPANGQAYLLHAAVASNYACSDATSGVAACSGPVASGVNFATGTVGAKSFTVTASDNAGNIVSATNAYAVIYNFAGFYPPVDNLPTINIAKAGQALPIKWSLKDANGNFVSDLATAVSYGYGSVVCSPGTTDVIDQYADAGSTSLRYDTIANQFILTSKTDKTWADSCKTFTLLLSDGTIHQAKFQFKK